MTTGAKSRVVAPTRRERQRAATYDEIVTVARQLLGSPDALSLRAVATEMGLTAPALYRYVDSYSELLMLVARAIFEDVISAMTSVRDRYGEDDPGAQILAASAAFRRWALEHPEEFGLIFANAATAKPDRAASFAAASTPGGGEQFSAFFTDIFLRLWDRYQFPLPADSDLEPALLKLLSDQRSSGTLPCDFPGHPVGLSWVFIRCWTRLYGTITLEVFKHLDHEVIQSGALFRAMLEDNARDLGFGDDWPRLRVLSMLELSR
jgi:AcrR family transcriptional regulator